MPLQGEGAVESPGSIGRYEERGTSLEIQAEECLRKEK